MICNRLFFCFLLIIIGTFITKVSGENVPNGSLVFVIDKTKSMGNVIASVMNNAISIFETVSSSTESPIENYVLVFFGDPIRTGDFAPSDFDVLVTKDRQKFKEALSLKVDKLEDGGDCPELSMEGIEKALDASLNGSFVYVFTDADAKDHKKYNSVKRLAQEKECQVVFILIKGRCELTNPDHEDVYSKLANATTGQVLYMNDGDMTQVLDYVEESVKNRKQTIHAKKYPPGFRKYEFLVGCKSSDVLMSLTNTKLDSGGRLKLNVAGPYYLEDIVNLNGVLVRTLEITEPGMYNVTFGNKLSSTYMVIKAQSNIAFRHGFSKNLVSSLNDTVFMPIAGAENYLFIKLFGENVTLTSVQLVNESYDIIDKPLPLELVDKMQNLYVTKPFKLPKKRFRITVNGTDKMCPEIPVIRIGNMVIETGTFHYKEPIITIKLGSKIVVDYNARLELDCLVDAYPEPDITWKKLKDGMEVPSISTNLAPNKFSAILELERAIKNETYICHANNSLGYDMKSIEVVVKQRHYLIITEEPKKNQTLKYDEQAVLKCKVDAFPPAQIFWYPQTKINRLMKQNKLTISADNSTLTIKHTRKEEAGNYTCVIKHDKLLHSKSALLTLSTRKPLIKKEPLDLKISVENGSSVTLNCSLIDGDPAEIKWYRSLFLDSSEKFIEMEEARNQTSKLLKQTNIYDSGTYKCEAKNVMGSDERYMQLIVHGKLKIIDNDTRDKEAKLSSKVDIKCEVEGMPDRVSWYKNDELLKDDIVAGIRIYRDNMLRLMNVTKNDTGRYKCKAVNKIEEAEKITNLTVYDLKLILPEETNIPMKLDHDVILACIAEGFPEPIKYKWIFYSYKTKRSTEISSTSVSNNGSLTIRNFKTNDQGQYTCVASVKGISKNMTYDVKLTSLQLHKPNVTDVIITKKEKLILHCNATGFPTPIQYEWSHGTNKLTKRTYHVSKNGTLRIKGKKWKTGPYTCVASTNGINENITYNVYLPTEPKIMDIPDYRAVQGDLCLEIICNASGNPKPTVEWWKDGTPVANDTNKLAKGGGFQFDDHWLKIWNISNEEHSFHCEAKNSAKKVSSNRFKVYVDEYPPPELIENVTTMYVATGTKKTFIKCYLPHDKIDWIVWYKDKKAIHWGELELNNVKQSDTGNYTCRVSYISLPNEIRTANTSVIVGPKPKFMLNVLKNVVMESKQLGNLDCRYTFSDKLTTRVTWCHNKNIMKFSENIYTFYMSTKSVGVYTCNVTNEFGNITRTFNVTYKVGECLLKLGSYAKHEPLLLTTTRTWPSFETSNNYTKIPAKESITLHCPNKNNKFKNFDTNNLTATCIGETIFLINGTYQDYADIECNEGVLPKLKYTHKAKEECLGEDTRKMELVFDIGHKDVDAYEYCVDREGNPIYVNYTMRAPSGYTPENTTMWDSSELDTYYSFKYQKPRFDKIFLDTRRCRFAARHLANPRDVFPGPLQRACYNRLNIVPHWSTCNENWDEVEKRVRYLATSLKTDLIIYTGTAGYWTNPLDGKDTKITLKRNVIIAAYLWKVIQHPETKSSIAIIQINIPGVSYSEVKNHILCTDICEEVHWSSTWRVIEKGFTYCCELDDFIISLQNKRIDRDFVNWKVFEPYYGKLRLD